MHKAFDVNCTGKSGFTPLHFALISGQRGAIEMLVKLGADINKPDRYGGETPLHIAARRGHHEVVSLLKKLGAKG